MTRLSQSKQNRETNYIKLVRCANKTFFSLFVELDSNFGEICKAFSQPSFRLNFYLKHWSKHFQWTFKTNYQEMNERVYARQRPLTMLHCVRFATTYSSRDALQLGIDRMTSTPTYTHLHGMLQLSCIAPGEGKNFQMSNDVEWKELLNFELQMQISKHDGWSLWQQCLQHNINRNECGSRNVCQQHHALVNASNGHLRICTIDHRMAIQWICSRLQ